MIGFMGTNPSIKKQLEKSLATIQVPLQSLSAGSTSNLHQLYQNLHALRALVVEAVHPALPQAAWLDLLEGVAARMPVVILNTDPASRQKGLKENGEKCVWLHGATAEDILKTLMKLGVIELKGHSLQKSIPVYTSNLAIQRLQEEKSISLLVIQTGEFRSIAIEYGQETYEQLRACFQQFLLSCWGEKDSFRTRDFLCKDSPTGSDYYILLERSRTHQGVPPPGALERMADRLYIQLQNRFWSAAFGSGTERTLPKVLRIMPVFSIGYASAVANPCLEGAEIMQQALERGKKVSNVHLLRIQSRKRELLQNIIEKDALLAPQYQAVFHLKDLPMSLVESAIQEKSIYPLAKFLYAFESLIRINATLVNELLQEESSIHLEATHLKPDVLFGIAHEVKLSLELDQTCLRKAISQFQGVPGKLLANILPRNFYHIDRFQEWFPADKEIIFEVSESEAIGNLSLLLEAKKKLSHRRFSIAIDDFGMGYAGLDRILEIRPQVVKLDRSLIENIHEEKAKQAYVKGLVATTRMTKSLLLAEGVEKIEELRTLQDLGVELVQGFLLHRPEPIEAIQSSMKGTTAPGVPLSRKKSKFPSAA